MQQNRQPQICSFSLLQVRHVHTCFRNCLCDCWLWGASFAFMVSNHTWYLLFGGTSALQMRDLWTHSLATSRKLQLEATLFATSERQDLSTVAGSIPFSQPLGLSCPSRNDSHATILWVGRMTVTEKGYIHILSSGKATIQHKGGSEVDRQV